MLAKSLASRLPPVIIRPTLRPSVFILPQSTAASATAPLGVGERVMSELTALDALAAVRFASIFRGFDSTGDYAEFFAALESKTPPA